MHRLPIPYTANAESLFLRLSDLPHCVWLDSGKPDSPLGRYDIISALPRNIVQDKDQECLLQKLNAELVQHKVEDLTLPFCGGWIGYLGYTYRHRNFGITTAKPDPLPEAWFGWYDWALIIDHTLKQAQLVFLDTCPAEVQDAVHHTLTRDTEVDTSFSCGPFKPDENRERYEHSLKRIRDYLLAGDCYQVNYAQRFSAHFFGSPIGAYLVLRRAVPSPFSAFLSLDQGAILSVSPERFIQINDRQALTQPIKGTAPRGNNKSEDDANRQALGQSEKNQAENLMIVDLLRNDFSRNCIPHSVKVPELFAIQSFANVHHLVSSITGILKPHITHPDFILSCFPGGSITGAPKKRSMEIIEELEEHSRSTYCGAIGYFSVHGASDFNIAIRTLIQHEESLYAWAGGGIVVDSDPALEYEESLHKIGSLLKAVMDKAASDPAASK